ncbi:hypothetical protein Tco_0373277 [Tanacetum coccineum]
MLIASVFQQPRQNVRHSFDPNSVNPDGPQHSSSKSSGFVLPQLNPNQDTGVDAIFGQQAEATSLTDIPVTTIVEPSFFAPTNRPPTPNPFFIQLQQPPILTLTTTPSSLLQNLPDFGGQAYGRLVAEGGDDGMEGGTEWSQGLCGLEINSSPCSQRLLSSVGMEANNSITSHNKKTSRRADDDQEPSARTDRGSKRRRSGKEPESTSAPRETTTMTTGKTTTGSKTYKQSASQSAPVEETMQSTDVFEAPAHQEFEQSVLAVHESIQPWLSNLARRQDPRESFDELIDTTFDFSAFVMNRLNVKTLTPELLAGPTFKLMKGTCKSLTELEYFCKEVYKATTEKLDWINPEGRQYPHDLQKPLPLVPNSQGRHVILFHHFINNDLEYLRVCDQARKYSTSVTKNKAVDYGHIKWIEDLVPNSMWSQVIVNYDKFALWGITHWGKKQRQFYAFATTRESARDVYSKRRIIAVTKFKEGNFHRLRIQDIEDMLLLLVQGKLTNLNVEEHIAFNVSLRMFTRSIAIQRRVEDLQLGVESYQKKLNLTKPDTYKSNLKKKDAYTPYPDPRGFIYENKDKKNRLMRIDELHKFSDGTLDDVRTALNDRLKGI